MTEVVLESQLGQFVDPYEFLYDDPSFGIGVAPISQISDRAEGRHRPIFETEQQLAVIRGQSRLLYDSTPVAVCALNSLVNYINGTGFSYEVEPVSELDVPEGVSATAQRVIDQFLDDNDWAGDRERELITRTRRDGESFTALYPQRNGRVRARFIEPEMVTEPRNPQVLELDHPDLAGIGGPICWSFGVATDEADVETVYGYHVHWNDGGTDWDYLPASHVHHQKVNVDRNIKRGVSDFFIVKGDLEREANLRRNMAEGAALQAAIAWIIEQAPGITKTQAAGIIGANATGQRTERTDTGGTRTRKTQRYAPGTIIKPNHGSVYKAGPMGAERNNGFQLVAAYVLRSIGIRWNMPEYMISGDASNANFASTLVAESPFVKAREHEQVTYKKAMRLILWKVLRFAYLAGRFERFGVSWEDVEAMLEIRVGAPAVASRDMLKVTQRNEIRQRMGIISNRSIAEDEGIEDYDAEMQRKEDDGDRPPAPAAQQTALPGLPSPAANETPPAEVTPETAESTASVESMAADLRSWRLYP